MKCNSWNSHSNVLFIFISISTVLLSEAGKAVEIYNPLTKPDGSEFNTATSTLDTCVSMTYVNCVDWAYVNTIESINASDPLYRQAFDAWSAEQAAGGGPSWGYRDGGALPGGRLEILGFGTYNVTDPGAGAQLRVRWSYDGPDRASFVWSQGLFVNWLPGPPAPPLDDSIYKLDPGRGSPVYTTRAEFSDFPWATWGDKIFDAALMIVSIDVPMDAEPTLTAYEGLRWGFELSVDPYQPEPPNVPLPASGALYPAGALMALVLMRWRRRLI